MKRLSLCTVGALFIEPDEWHCAHESEGNELADTDYEEGSRDALNMCANWLVFVGENSLADRFIQYCKNVTEGEISQVPERAIITAASPTELAPAKMGRAEARQGGFTGDSCSLCGSMRMKHTGHCNTCEECGTTTGCS